MGTALQINVTFDQVLAIVRQLPRQEKIKLSKELQKDTVASKLSELQTIFKTEELSLETINEEVEIVRQQIYEGKKH